MMKDPYPLAWPSGWPRTSIRLMSKFKVSSFAYARDSVMRQVRQLGGSYIVITSNLPARQDGLPYANASEPADPGIAVWWVKDGREHAIACDRWTKTRDNLHSLELSLEALRGLTRWGSTSIAARALAGFRALGPAPIGEPEWRSVLGLWIRTMDEARTRYRELAHQMHPDRGGSTVEMRRLTQAWEAAQAELGG